MSLLSKHIILAVAGLCAPLASLAQNQPTTPRQLNEVTVTASRIDQKPAQTGKVVTVLSDSVLQRYAGQSLGEVLTRQAGLMIVGAQGPLGTNQEIYLRGAGTGNTLILIDGVPAYDPAQIDPSFDLNQIPVDNCERIEILRGASSTLYGSGAVAGVISIFTRTGTGQTPAKAVRGAVSAGYGSYGTFRGTASVSGNSAKAYYNLQYTRQSSTGFSAAADPGGTTAFAPNGFRQNALLGNVGVDLNPNLTLKLRGTYGRYVTDLDAGPFRDERDYMATNSFAQLSAGLEYRFKTGKITANYGLSRSIRDYRNDSSFVDKGAFSTFEQSVYGGRAQFAEAYTSLRIGPLLSLVAGTEYRNNNTDQTYYSISEYGPYSSPPLGRDTARTSLLSGYVSALVRHSAFSVELSGRLNRHSLYGTNFTYTVNPSYLIRERTKVFLNLSSGFRAPSLYQLYSPYGNRKLSPETSQSFEAGVQFFGRNPAHSLRLLYFDRQIRNVIVFLSLPKAPYAIYQNQDRQHDQGLELEGQTTWRGFALSTNVTWVKGRVTQSLGSRDTTYNNLFRRPALLVNASVGRQLTPALFVSLSLRSVGQRTDRFYNEATFKTESTMLPAYTTLDLYAEYRFGRRVRLFGDLRNLTNTRYADSYGYNTRGRNGTVGLQIGW
jgi:vitamin B12 transporter